LRKSVATPVGEEEFAEQINYHAAQHDHRENVHLGTAAVFSQLKLSNET
jgi:hypothetical protein